LGCKSPQGADDSGLDRLDLSKEKRITALNLIGLWIPILGRTTFDNVCDIDLLSLKIDRSKDVSQELSGFSNKGLALDILFVAWAFTNDHQFGLFITFPEYKGMPGSMEFTSMAIPQIVSHLF
jgi:hypothetical protein